MLPPALGWNKIKTRHQQRTSGTRYHLISLLQSAAYPLTQATIIHFLIIPPKCPIMLLIVETFTRRFLSALHFTKSLFFIGCTYSVLISSFFVNRKFTFLKRRSHYRILHKEHKAGYGKTYFIKEAFPYSMTATAELLLSCTQGNITFYICLCLAEPVIVLIPATRHAVQMRISSFYIPGIKKRQCLRITVFF